MYRDRAARRRCRRRVCRGRRPAPMRRFGASRRRSPAYRRLAQTHHPRWEARYRALLPEAGHFKSDIRVTVFGGTM